MANEEVAARKTRQKEADASKGKLKPKPKPKGKLKPKPKPKGKLKPKPKPKGKLKSNEKVFYCFPSAKPIKQEIVTLNLELEEMLGLKLIYLIQANPGRCSGIDIETYDWLYKIRQSFKNKDIGLVIESPGGDARAAYLIGTLFQKYAKSFTAIVPRIAKSAATLVSLGAKKILMGKMAELGPLDAQLYDSEREKGGSALNTVQAIERLHSVAIQAVDSCMFVFLNRTKKKIDTILPMTMNFVANTMRPMFENLNVEEYTERSRILKVGEEYAIRLMERSKIEEPKKIARKLVEKYPEHGFVIDFHEAKEIGLMIECTTPVVQQKFDLMFDIKGTDNMIGALFKGEGADNEEESEKGKEEKE